jgi:phosphatidylglycerophosphatase C
VGKTPEPLTPSQLIARLDRERPDGESVLLFDADGTLWQGDAAENAFELAIYEASFKHEAEEHLRRASDAHDLPIGKGSYDIAATILDEYRVGKFPELTICELMIWSFIGFTPEELADLARRALSKTNLESRRNRTLEPVLDWARKQGIRTLIVSASPRWVLSVALEPLGFASADIVASTSVFRDGKATLELEMPVPYAGAKVTEARKRTGHAFWLAAFGDSPFDFEMMAESKLAVAVSPKPALVSRIGNLPTPLLLLEEPGGPR